MDFVDEVVSCLPRKFVVAKVTGGRRCRVDLLSSRVGLVELAVIAIHWMLHFKMVFGSSIVRFPTRKLVEMLVCFGRIQAGTFSG